MLLVLLYYSSSWKSTIINTCVFCYDFSWHIICKFGTSRWRRVYIGCKLSKNSSWQYDFLDDKHTTYKLFAIIFFTIFFFLFKMWVLDLHKLYHVCRAVGRTVPQKCDGVLPPGISVGDGIVFTRAEHGPGSIILRVPLPCGPILGPLFSRHYQKPLEGCAANSHCIIKINF